MNRHVNDLFVKNSKKEGLRSRSSYKLIEVQEKRKFIKPHSIVVDLGAAPGGWSMATTKYIRKEAGGRVIAVDLLKYASVENCVHVQGDFTHERTLKEVETALDGRAVDVLLSDMLHNTTGHKQTDHFRSLDLCYAALDFADSFLGTGGSIFMKFLRGQDDKELVSAVQKLQFIDGVKILKPAASRKESAEAYLLAMGRAAPTALRAQQD
jgi:23S rRNA (uridine2552-2'-O)-methyltransferase